MIDNNIVIIVIKYHYYHHYGNYNVLTPSVHVLSSFMFLIALQAILYFICYHYSTYCFCSYFNCLLSVLMSRCLATNGLIIFTMYMFNFKLYSRCGDEGDACGRSNDPYCCQGFNCIPPPRTCGGTCTNDSCSEPTG